MGWVMFEAGTAGALDSVWELVAGYGVVLFVLLILIWRENGERR